MVQYFSQLIGAIGNNGNYDYTNKSQPQGNYLSNAMNTIFPQLDFNNMGLDSMSSLGNVDFSTNSMNPTTQTIPSTLNNDMTSGSDFASFSSFANTFNMFNMFMNNPMGFDFSNSFNQSFNTQNNLDALQSVYNPDLSNKLANIANNVATGTNTVGYCAAGVVDALEEANLTSSGEARAEAAYEIAPKLRNSNNFKEVSVSREDLSNLPAGCVVVWDASEGHQYGHITVTLGPNENGEPQEASDHVQGLITDRDAAFSVFVPVASNG